MSLTGSTGAGAGVKQKLRKQMKEEGFAGI